MHEYASFRRNWPVVPDGFESLRKSRIITVDQMRELRKQIQLKPNEAAFKLAIIVAADRLRVEAANAFLKALEEPPRPVHPHRPAIPPGARNSSNMPSKRA